MTKNNGVNKLSKEMDDMRMQAVEVELKARYWKAQYDVRYYTLEAEKLQPEYESYMQKQAEKREELQKLYLEQMEKNKEAGLEMTHILTQEDLDANPELVEQGLGVGDEVQLGPSIEPSDVIGDPSETN